MHEVMRTILLSGNARRYHWDWSYRRFKALGGAYQSAKRLLPWEASNTNIIVQYILCRTNTFISFSYGRSSRIQREIRVE
jgi:hypothetical protein